MIAAGTLNQRIQIIPTLRAQGTNGELTEGPDVANAVTVWAAVRQQSAAERQRNGITSADNSYAIRIRYRADVAATSSITYRGRTLSIAGVVEGGMQNREWLDITAMEAK